MLRDYRIPVIVEMVWYAKNQHDYPKMESMDVREVVYVGKFWPSPDEVHDAIGEYHLKFGRSPDRIVLPRLHAAKFFGVELVA
jgi:hypothetical protein